MPHNSQASLKQQIDALVALGISAGDALLMLAGENKGLVSADATPALTVVRTAGPTPLDGFFQGWQPRL